MALGYGLYYVMLEPVGGFVGLLGMAALSITASSFAATEDAIFIATIVHFTRYVRARPATSLSWTLHAPIPQLGLAIFRPFCI